MGLVFADGFEVRGVGGVDKEEEKEEDEDEERCCWGFVVGG